MAESDILQLLFHGNQLKRTARTGWVQRGVVGAEFVAAHSYGVAYIVLILSHYIAKKFDKTKALTMAILHDLPEGLTSDIPTPAWNFLPPGIKTEVERGAMKEILGGVPFDADLISVWEELHASQSLEALLVHDADKLDMYLQAYMYEKETSNQHLAEFWTDPYRFAFQESQAVFDYLSRLRNGE